MGSKDIRAGEAYFTSENKDKGLRKAALDCFLLFFINGF